MEANSLVLMGLVIVLVPITGILMAITPYLMKKSECFAVTVPTIAAADPYLRRLKRSFFLAMITLTVLATLLCLVFLLLDNPAGVISSMAIGTVFLCGAGYALMLYFRKKTSTYKREQGWEAGLRESVAVIGEVGVPRAIALSWNLLYLPVFIVTILIGVVGYAHMPEQIPMQMGLDGSISRWVEKTPIVVAMPVVIQAFLAACMVFSHWTITRSKKLSEPGAPATSALAYGMFARAQSIYLLVLGMAICIAMIAMPLTFIGVVTMMQASVLIMVAAIVAVGGAIAISVVYGQGGARVFARMQGSGTLLADEDEFWKLGVFYYNPDDSSLFLPERFGIGWTFNWARPAVWAIMVAGLLVTVGFVVVIMTLF